MTDSVKTPLTQNKASGELSDPVAERLVVRVGEYNADLAYEIEAYLLSMARQSVEGGGCEAELGRARELLLTRYVTGDVVKMIEAALKELGDQCETICRLRGETSADTDLKAFVRYRDHEPYLSRGEFSRVIDFAQGQIERAKRAEALAAPPVGQVFCSEPNDRQTCADALARHVLKYDHYRGCQGQEYTCSCGYDGKMLALATAALQPPATPGYEPISSLPIPTGGGEPLADFAERNPDGLGVWPDYMRKTLLDPQVIHLNMLRGGIAKLSPAQIGHLYRGDEANAVIAEIVRQNPDAALQSDLDAARERVRELEARFDRLSSAARKAMPVLSDRYVGGRMVTPKEYAGEVFEEIKAALSNPVTEGEGK